MRFFLGDDNGQLKVANCASSATEWKVDISVLDKCSKSGREKAVQKLAVYNYDRISAARADGSISLFHIPSTDEPPSLLKEWRETRIKHEEKFVGLAFTNDGHAMSCTNNGHLSLAQCADDSIGSPVLKNTIVPKRLCDWKLSSDSKHFVYGGEEVEISLWDTERAFDDTRNTRKPEPLTQLTQSKKRKASGPGLLDGEIWRAKNVPNDSLNLRQPVHNTTLTFVPLSGNSSLHSYHIVSGTRLGSVRRYDTRAARKPIANWKDISRSGGIQAIETGNTEHEVYVSDCGSDLIALDLRTGRVLYKYSGLAGTISSIASTSSAKAPFLASASLDRYFRLHTTDRASDKKPGVLTKTWTKTVSTCVAWDGRFPEMMIDEEEENTDAIWDGITGVIGDKDGLDESDEDEENISHKKRKKI